MEIVIPIILIVLVFGLWWYNLDTKIVRIKKKHIMDFKAAVDLVGLPIVTFYQGDKKYHFILDTGSNVSMIDSYSDIVRKNVQGSDISMGTCGKVEVTKADLELYYNKQKYVLHDVRVSPYVKATLDDIKEYCNMTITGLIGGDFLNKYNYCIDYKDFVAYERK